MPTPSQSLYPSPGLYPGDVGPFTQRLLDSWHPWLDVAPTLDLYNWLVAIGAMFDTVTGLVQDQGFSDDADYTPGWSVLLDPDNCPTAFLPWLGQFVGVVVPPGTDDATARSLVKAEAGFQRGTPGAITTAATRNLTGTQSCVLLERTGINAPDAYHFLLICHPSEVLSVSELKAAVNAVRPAGLTWDLVLTDSWTIFQMEGQYATVAALEGAFTTVNGLERDQVGS